MAGASLLALLDDIATVLDDVALLTKVAARKSAGVLGDDLALNAEQVSGVRADRELPVVWAVAKGSALNKLVLVPAALLISAIAPVLIPLLLMLGGAFLCYEGVEKILHPFLHRQEADREHEALRSALADPTVNLKEFEQEKIKGAIRTDFVLSAEIIVIALGSVQEASMLTQVLVVTTIAIAMTVGVYGLVALIVKLDDIGLHLLKRSGTDALARLGRVSGRALLAFCPVLMKTLAIVGTAAMFLVGGGILVHGIPYLHHLSASWTAAAGALPASALIIPLLVNLLTGLICGVLVLIGVSGIQKVREA